MHRNLQCRVVNDWIGWISWVFSCAVAISPSSVRVVSSVPSPGKAYVTRESRADVRAVSLVAVALSFGKLITFGMSVCRPGDHLLQCVEI